MIRSFSVVMMLWLSGLVHAQQSDPVTYCADTLLLQLNTDEVPYLQWLVGTHTTLETILTHTGLTGADLRELNPILYFRNIESCDRILIPVRAAQFTRPDTEEPYPVYYRVRKGETIFGIAHRVLDIPVDTLLKMNHLTTYDLKPGQLLHAGFLSLDGDAVPADPEHTWSSSWIHHPGYIVDTQMVNMSPTKSYMLQRGVAWWNKDMNDPNLFALHRNAPLNSLIEIRNPMFGRSVWAKVIGTIPPTYTDDISVIVSPGVAKYLGAIDGRFYVEMSYEVN